MKKEFINILSEVLEDWRLGYSIEESKEIYDSARRIVENPPQTPGIKLKGVFTNHYFSEIMLAVNLEKIINYIDYNQDDPSTLPYVLDKIKELTNPEHEKDTSNKIWFKVYEIRHLLKEKLDLKSLRICLYNILNRLV